MTKSSICHACQRAKHGICRHAVLAICSKQMAVGFARFDRCALKAHHAITNRLVKDSAVALAYAGK